MARLWIVSQLYYPEESATGYYLTGIAEGLAPHMRVHVLCGQPSYHLRGLHMPRNEQRNGVRILRCWSTALDNNVLLYRAVNYATTSLSMLLRSLVAFRRGDAALVVTNPPTLPFVIALASRLRGVRLVLLVHDVYPQVLVAAGLLRPGSALERLLSWAARRLYQSVDQIVVLGRDMAALASAKLGESGVGKVEIIPNWADTDDVVPLARIDEQPTDLPASGKFVVQYSGNMGRTHDISTVIECARLLEPGRDVRFDFIGAGAKERWLREAVHERGLANVTVMARVDRKQLSESLNACSVAIIALVPGMAGVSVPSRTYNIMAAGKPVIALADESSEIAHLIHEHHIGWVVTPHSPRALADAIADAQSDTARLLEMGARARRVAEACYSRQRVLAQYRDLFSRLLQAD